MNIHLKKPLLVFFSINSLLINAQTQITIDNESFFDYVIPLIDQGHNTIIPAKGKGMIPFINDGEKILLEKSVNYNKGDIVLARLSNGNYVLHRVISISKDSVSLMGDANLYYQQCHIDSLKAICRVKYDKQHCAISLDTNIQKARVELWQACLSQRDVLLSSFPIFKDNYWEDIFLSRMKSGKGLLLSVRTCYNIMEINKIKCLISKDSQIIDFSELVTLNESAMYLFTKVKGQKFRLHDMVEFLLQEYEVDEQTANNDCLNLLTKWFSSGIIKVEN